MSRQSLINARQDAQTSLNKAVAEKNAAYEKQAESGIWNAHLLDALQEKVEAALEALDSAEKALVPDWNTFEFWEQN